MYYAACKVNDGGEDGDPCGGTSSDKIGNTGSNICSGSGGLIEAPIQQCSHSFETNKLWPKMEQRAMFSDSS